MIVSSIDLGTNSFKCMIATLKEKNLKILFDDAKIVRIGQDIETSRLISKKSLKRADEVVNFFSQKIKEYGVEKIKVVATSAARDAKNLDELINLLKTYNLNVQIISGKEEGVLSYKGAVYGRIKGNYLVIDIGGGSTEIVLGNTEDIQSHSLDIGALRLTNKFVSNDPILPVEVEKISSEIKAQLANINLSNIKPLIGVKTIGIGGTINTLLRLKSFNLESNNLILLDDLNIIFKKISVMKAVDIASFGIHSKRADIIVTGGLILIEILKSLDISSIEVSPGGVRLALATQMLHEQIC